MLLTVTQSSYKYVYLQKLHNYISFMEIQHSYQANLRMKQQKEIVQFCTCRHGQNVQQYSQGVEQGGELNSTIQTVSSLETTCLRICAMRTAMSLLCLKIISHQAPIYLSELLHLYTPSQQLRSTTDTRVFRIPSFRTKSCGQRSFSYQALSLIHI